MITFDHVSKKFPLGNLALDDVSLAINDEEFLFLVGPSGAGKTTIIKLTLRQFLPSTGVIVVNDEEITNKRFRSVETLRRSIGVVFQDFKIIFEKNIFENIAVALKVSGIKEAKIKDEALHVLSLVGLEDKKLMFPVQLSAGELQRVAIARAIIGERNIILADEPTGNLDPKTSWEIMKIFKKLEGKKTIVIATHNVDIVNSMKRRVIALKNGKIVKDQRKGGYEL